MYETYETVKKDVIIIDYQIINNPQILSLDFVKYQFHYSFTNHATIASKNTINLRNNSKKMYN